MKKILISAIALVFGVTAMNAQSPWFLGGELGFKYDDGVTKNEVSGEQTKFNIKPMVGYMFNDSWGITFDVSLGIDNFKPATGDKTKETSYGVGVGAIYKVQIVDKFFYAPTLRVGYERLDEAKTNKIGADLNFFRFELRPSCNWGLSFNFGSLGYLNTKPNNGDATNAFGLNVGDAASVGFTYYF